MVVCREVSWVKSFPYLIFCRKDMFRIMWHELSKKSLTWTRTETGLE